MRIDGARRSVLSRAVAEGQEVPLDDLLDRIEAGKSFGGVARGADPDEWGVIKVSAMTWGAFRPYENKRVPADAVQPRWEIRRGDLLVSRANTTEYVGAAVLVGETRPRLLLSDKSLRLIVREGVDKEWLLYALSAPQTRRQISAEATGTSDSMRNISQEKLRGVHLRVPKPTKQAILATSISTDLHHLDILSSALPETSRKAVALRRAILARAFRGELASQGRGDEPASVLLERIAAERAAAGNDTGGRDRRRATIEIS
jgi:type I restriction enzyme, S subunit